VSVFFQTYLLELAFKFIVHIKKSSNQKLAQ
jgi:hypothetical protein